MDKRFKYGDLVRVTHTYVGRVSQNEERDWILINPETHERLGYFNGVDRAGYTYTLVEEKQP